MKGERNSTESALKQLAIRFAGRENFQTVHYKASGIVKQNHGMSLLEIFKMQERCSSKAESDFAECQSPFIIIIKRRESVTSPPGRVGGAGIDGVPSAK